MEFLNEFGFWFKRCVSKNYHNDKYVQLRIPVLKNSCSIIDGAHGHSVTNSRSFSGLQHYYVHAEEPGMVVYLSHILVEGRPLNSTEGKPRSPKA